MGAAGLMMGAQAAGGLYSAWAQGQQAKVSEGYYSSLANTARTNADLSDAAAVSKNREITYKQSQDQRKLGEGIRQTLGSQRAALAAGGAGVGSKTGEQIMSDTIDRGSLDEMALQYNADLARKETTLAAKFRRLDLEGQASGYMTAGRNARTAGRMNQISTILGTGTQVAGSWYAGRPGSANAPRTGTSRGGKIRWD